MKIDKNKPEIALAKNKATLKGLSESKKLAGGTIIKIRQGKDVMPKTVGLLSDALGVPVEELIKTE